MNGDFQDAMRARPNLSNAEFADFWAELHALRAQVKALREQLQDCTLFIRQACEQKILDRAECKPLLKQWESALEASKP